MKPLLKILLGCLLLAALPLAGQESPAILIKTDSSGTERSLRLETLRIDVKVHGNLATTTMEMIFYNDLNRVLEGNLYFPLGEGQSVSRFAMEVNGDLREGVVVEKDKGRQVFESVVRRQIDPGLLERTRGNNFKSRIYPIPAKGHKRLLVAYEQELKHTDAGPLYLLPLQFKEAVRQFSLRVEVFKQPVQPAWDRAHEMANLRFERWRESYLAEANYQDYLPNRQLAFTLPQPAGQPRLFVENVDGQRYFYLTVTPEISEMPQPRPGKITLLWDASGSAAGRDLEKELALLDRYFRTIGDAEVALVLFSNEVASPVNYPVQGGNWEKLRTRLQKVHYDGGTQLGAINPANYDGEVILLFSDGISNFGEAEIVPGNRPVLSVSSQATTEHGYLEYLARSSGGVYLNLQRLTVAEAAAQLTRRPFRFISAEYDRRAVSEIYPSLPEVVDDGTLSLAGLLLQDEAEITLNFGIGEEIQHQETITLNRQAEVPADGLIRRIWAQKQIAELDIFYRKNAAEITRLGKRYGIVTRQTSLIVLDRVEDYAEHHILPPPALQEAYFALLESSEREAAETREAHLAEVVEMFQERQAWWQRDFPQDLPREEEESDGGHLMERFSAMRMSPEAAEDGASSSEQRSAAGAGRAAQQYNGVLSIESSLGGSGGSDADAAPAGAIALSAWDPATPYLKRIGAAPPEAWAAIYREEKSEYPNSSAFFLDMADFYIAKEQPDTALRVLSNIAEMELENPQLLRILGHRLSQLNYPNLARSVFEDVLEMRPEEPQSYRDLGLVCAAAGDYQRAVDLLYEVVTGQWDDRFPQIELIALDELNALAALHGDSLDLSTIDPRLRRNLPVDIRVVLNWDADNCDMDLWVTDPNGEKCYYDNNQSYIGGIMSRDFTRGYGPEAFMLRRSKAGEYRIQVNYYGNSQQVLAGATTIQVTLYTDFGRPQMARKDITMRLEDVEEVIDVGRFLVGDVSAAGAGSGAGSARLLQFSPAREAGQALPFLQHSGIFLLALLLVMVLLVPNWRFPR
ncbi:MAG: DUF2135 domain-containing protein [Calditrichae bacterium]|nr:DUF2135 domain-containing protein [Calditrichia bacterium]